MPKLSDLFTKNLVVAEKIVEKEPDTFTKGEEDFLIRQQALEREKIETELKRHDLDQRKQEHTQRVSYARKIYWLICAWLIVILLIVIASGSNCKYFTLEISDRVLITLLTTTTVTVFGLFVTVLKYIYSKKS